MTPNMRRAAARQAMLDHDISQRRACKFVGVDPKAVQRDKPPDSPEVRWLPADRHAVGTLRNVDESQGAVPAF